MKETIRHSMLLVMLFVSMAAVAVAQDLAGTIIDEKGEPVPFVSVTLLDNDSAYVIGTTTDEMGRFNLPHSSQATSLRASCIGYRTTVVPIMASPMTITMPEDAVALQAVEVVTMRHLVKHEDDRLSYNLSADPESRTSSVLDMLRKVPMVSVDAQNNVRVRGEKSFTFYRNGHPDPALNNASAASEILQSMPASSVERIEVITEPGAKYDAEGASVILNIVTSRTSRNSTLNGTVTAGVNTRGVTDFGLQLAGAIGKLVLSGSAGGKLAPTMSATSEEDIDYTYATSGMRQLSKSKIHSAYSTLRGQIDASYEIDSLNLFTVAYSQNRWFAYPRSTTAIEYYDSTGTLLSQSQLLSGKDVGDGIKNSITGRSLSARLDYEHRTHLKDEVITASYMFSHRYDKEISHNSINEIFNSHVPYSAYDSHSKDYINEHTLQLDYQRPLWTSHLMETGLKYIHRRNSSHTTTSYTDAESMNLDEKFEHTTQVAAAYLSWLYKVRAVSLRGGLRYEFSYLSAHFPYNPSRDFHSSLNDLVPSFTFNWHINPSNSLRLSYSTRIRRPNIYYLNPTMKETLTTRSYGNPDLPSTHSRTVGLTYSFLSNKLTFNFMPSISVCRNWIDRYNFVDDEGFIVNTYSNDNRYVHSSLEGFMQWMPTAKTTLVLNGRATYIYRKSISMDMRRGGWGGFAYAQLTQELFWKIKGSIGLLWIGIGHYPDYLYGYFHGSRPEFDISLRRSFLDDRLSVSLRANDFTHRRICWETVYTQGDLLGHDYRYTHYRNISLNLSYRFGKSRTRVKRTATTIENNDQMGGD